MNNIPIFDSLTHPMPNGNWIIPKYDGQNSIQELLSEMAANNIQWALAVGMGISIGEYQEEEYAFFVRNFSENLFPVAFVDFGKIESGAKPKEYLKRLKNLGYVGIKIHPRLSDISLSDPLIPVLVKEANDLDLAVLLCTYIWSQQRKVCGSTPEQLQLLLSQIPDSPIMLMHGGAVRVLEVAEIVRHFPEVLLDLSFTICKYEGSSIDLDIKFLFEKFDQRICIGSDSPEFRLSKLRERFNFFSDGLSLNKRTNIAYKNLQSYIRNTCTK